MVHKTCKFLFGFESENVRGKAFLQLYKCDDWLLYSDRRAKGYSGERRVWAARACIAQRKVRSTVSGQASAPVKREAQRAGFDLSKNRNCRFRNFSSVQVREKRNSTVK